MGELQGRSVLVTGASRDIGAAIAKRFGAEGARVAITARTLDQHDHLDGTLRDTASFIEAQGAEALPIPADLGDAGGLDKIVTQAEAAFGPIEILVNNAAAAFYIPFTQMSEKRFCVANNINFYAPWRLSQDDALAVAESREAMAEAAVALCVTNDPQLNGRITYCTPILEELSRTIKTIDGKTVLAGPLEHQAAGSR